MPKVSPGVVILVVMMSAALGPVAGARTQPRPPIQVVAPTPATGALEPDDLPPPQSETVTRTSIVDMPTVPDFLLPVTEPGFQSPRALQVRSKAILGTDVQVKGYVTWIYDCGAALAEANRHVPRVQLLRAMDQDAALCEQPKIYLGDARDTARGASIWVVDMPRAPNRQERLMLAKNQLKAWPEPPRLAIGDYVVVTGTWALRSPHNEHNSNGLLVYKSVARAVPPPAVAIVPSPPSLPAIEVVTTPPLRPVVEPGVRDASIELLNACNRAIAAKRYDDALKACDAATRTWDGNHLAWYARASIHMVRSEWGDARMAIERAVAPRPDIAMYQLYHGMALYETGALDAARDALRRAVRLSPALWRGHYYLGRLYRQRDEARLAAEQFTQTIKTHPGYRFGYIALGELYRKWGYVDLSLVVATLGTTNVAPAESADLWLQIGMAYDAKSADDKALVALGRALAIRPSDPYAKMHRGRLYFRHGDVDLARRDLQDVAKTTDPELAVARQLALDLLSRIDGTAEWEAGRKTLCNASNLCQVMTPPNSSWAGVNPITRL